MGRNSANPCTRPSKIADHISTSVSSRSVLTVRTERHIKLYYHITPQRTSVNLSRGTNKNRSSIGTGAVFAYFCLLKRSPTFSTNSERRYTPLKKVQLNFVQHEPVITTSNRPSGKPLSIVTGYCPQTYSCLSPTSPYSLYVRVLNVPSVLYILG